MGAFMSCLNTQGKGDNRAKKAPKVDAYDLIDESTWNRTPASLNSGTRDVSVHDDTPVYQNANNIPPPTSRTTPPSLRVSPKPARQHPYDEITHDTMVANRQAAREMGRASLDSTTTTTTITTTDNTSTTSTTNIAMHYTTTYSLVTPQGAGCVERGGPHEDDQEQEQDQDLTYMNTGRPGPAIPGFLAVETPQPAEAKQLNYVQVEFNSSNAGPGIRTKPPYEPTNYSSVIHSNGNFYTIGPDA